jgi:hypothetical protein
MRNRKSVWARRVQRGTLFLWAVSAVDAPRSASAQDGSQQQTSLQALAPASPSGPVPLGVNGQVTPWLQVRGELRARIEGFTGGGFADNDDAYWMDRFRLNATVRPSKSVAFVVQAQDARAFEKTTGSQAVPLRDTLDLRMAYGEFGSTSSIRVGRQELAFGEQRLIGHLGWANTARSFDGARMTLKRQGFQLDTFAASVVTIRPDAFDKSGAGNALYGAYGSLSALIPKQVVEPFFFWRQSSGVAAELGGTATIHQATTGARMAGKIPASLDYSSEVAMQTGSVGLDTIKAWAALGLLGKTLGNVPAGPRLFAEYNYASGDANRADGARGTFDQLYPTGHDKLGLSDQVGWRNIRHARAGIELKPAPKWQMNSSYHSWWLASAADGLYSASGALIARSVAGTAGSHVGQELDAQATYAYSPQLQIGGGFAHVFPGEFLTKTTAGHSYSYPYVMLTYVFIGETPAIGARQSR